MSAELRPAAWAERAVHERRAHRRYTRIADRLEGAGWPADLVLGLRHAAMDEARHAALCDNLAGRPSCDAPVPEATPAHWDAASRAVYEGVVHGCIGETLNVVLLQGERELTEDPTHRARLSGLLRDEVSHAQLGWSLLMHASKRGRTQWLTPHLTPALERWLGPERKGVPREGPQERLPFRVRRQRYRDTLADVVLPGFERCGVEISEPQAWLARWER